jgi:DNA-binding NtrC family response regulator
VKPRVLVIDDKDAVCNLLSLYLGEQGLEVATVRSAAEARAVIERGQFDLVILDWMLKGAERPDLLHLCTARHPDIPVIIFTAADLDEPCIKDLLARGADAVFRKKGPLDALSATICRSLARRQVQPLNAA